MEYTTEFYLRWLIVGGLMMLWYELDVISDQLKFRRVKRFTNRLKCLVLVFGVIRLIIAVIEIWNPVVSTFIAVITTALFFILVAMLVRWRRKSLLEEWNKQDLGNGELFNDIHQKLEETEVLARKLEK